jgi:hypothetical protein
MSAQNMSTHLTDMIPVAAVPDVASAVVKSVFDFCTFNLSHKSHSQTLLDTESAIRKLIQHSDSFLVEQPSPDMVFADSLESFLLEEIKAHAHPRWQYVMKMVTASRELNKIRQKTNEAIGRILQQVKTCLLGGSPTDAQASLDKSIRAYEKDKSKRKGSSDRRSATIELSQRTLQLAACDYLRDMQNLQERREIELVQHLSQVFRVQFNALEQSTQALKELVSDADVLKQHFDRDREGIDKSRALLNSLRQNLHFVHKVSEQRLTDVERSEKELKKQDKKGFVKGRWSSADLLDANNDDEWKDMTLKKSLFEPQAPAFSRGISQPIISSPSQRLLPSSAAGSTSDVSSMSPRAISSPQLSRRSSLSQMLAALRRLSTNSQCADCNDPTITHLICDLGVFVCSDCAEVHKLLRQSQPTWQSSAAATQSMLWIGTTRHQAQVRDLASACITFDDVLLAQVQ